MKILAQTANSLRLRQRSLENWFIDMIFCLLSMLTLSLFPVGQIHCQRQTLPYGCIITTTYFVIQERVNIPLPLLRQAKLEEDIDSESDRIYRIVLDCS
ncbi:MAG: hypothetical protein KatS3mg045_2044 [Bellilinea sp.]|nr:MAG: hypothetical protein KatS3mg045_2044 [Bellilinea sp.]